MIKRNILVIRSKRHLSQQKLKDFQRFWSNQMLTGIVVIPDEFEFVSLDPKTLKPCPLEWQETKPSLWERIKRRFKHDNHTRC